MLEAILLQPGVVVEQEDEFTTTVRHSTVVSLAIPEVCRTGAAAGTPLVLNWDDDEVQGGTFASGFDLFGFPSFNRPPEKTTPILMPAGCSYFIRRDLYLQLGGLDPVIFMYADEWDLSWKVWATGHSAVVVPSARLHHRGAANVNPAGGR